MVSFHEKTALNAKNYFTFKAITFGAGLNVNVGQIWPAGLKFDTCASFYSYTTSLISP